MSYTQLSATERFTLYQLHTTEQKSIQALPAEITLLRAEIQS